MTECASHLDKNNAWIKMIGHEIPWSMIVLIFYFIKYYLLRKADTRSHNALCFLTGIPFLDWNWYIAIPRNIKFPRQLVPKNILVINTKNTISETSDSYQLSDLSFRARLNLSFPCFRPHSGRQFFIPA